MIDPKYKVGDRVHVDIVRGLDGYEWSGTVTRVADAGEDDTPAYEYWVSNGPTLLGFPLLAWEHEVSPIPTA